MEQCLDAKHKFKRGMKVKFFDNRDGTPQGTFYFVSFVDDHTLLARREDTSNEVPGDMRLLYVEFLECVHQWQRLDLFRTTEFCCKLCPAVRPFNIETDEAA